jgi:hypothetical protein
MVFLGFVLFIIMGFRYRIILSLLGIFILYVFQSKFFKFSTLIKSLMIFLFVIFITSNRYNFAKGDFSNSINNFKKSNADLIFEQTRSSLPDLAIFKYFNENSSNQVSFDYGQTFFYAFVRFLPRSIFGDIKDSLYPPPAFIVIERAYSLPNDLGTLGETPSFYSYFYIAFGALGVCFFSFLLGYVIKILKVNIDFSVSGMVLQVILGVSLFQFVSRGYFPQYIDTLFFMIIPLFFFKKKAFK